VTAVWNKSPITARWLGDIKPLVERHNAEVIVVDNGSTDKSLIFLETCNIKLIKNPIGLGAAVARNQGSGIAKGEYLAFFDNDTIVDKGCISEMLKALKKYRASMCQAKLLRMGSNLFDSCGSDIGQFGFLIDRIGAVEDNGQMDYVYPLMSLKTAGCMVERAVFPGFTENYFMYLEDTDLCLRLWNKGYRVVFAHKAKVWHAFDTPFKDPKTYDMEIVRYYGCRNYIWTIARNTDGLLLKHILCWIGIGIFFLLKKNFKEAKYIFKGIRDALLGLPKRKGSFKVPVIKQSLLYYLKKGLLYANFSNRSGV